jgi:hypothetical protein
MARRAQNMLIGATVGAAIALGLSAATLLLPIELGGYNAWTDPHLVLHNLSAILVRLTVFALAGVALRTLWHRRRRFHR